MILHLTARLAWHDNYWNGRICRKPSENIYCSGNYSLLSTRIQRRKNSELEDKYAGKPASEIVEKEDYIPPCYWVINLLEDKKLEVKHVHPFCDFIKKAKEGGIKPIKDTIEPHAILSWSFKFSFAREGILKYPRDLEDRLNHYLSYIIPGKSVVIFYLNYSNPVNGDRHKYLIAGAALVKDIRKPKQYEFDPEYYEHLKKQFRGYFPPMEWSFQIVLDPETIVIIPYQEYIKELEEAKSEEEKRKIEELLSEIVVEVDKQSLIPHFKYVSMHISTDKVLYLLYKMLNSLNRAKEHGIVEKEPIEEYIRRTEDLIKHLWRLRGEYPSLGKVLIALGEILGHYTIILNHTSETTTDYKKYKEIEEKLSNFFSKYGIKFIEIMKTADPGRMEILLNELNQDNGIDSYTKYLISQIIKFIRDRGSEYLKALELLCRLDLAYAQIRNIIRNIENKKIDIEDLVNYPYSLVYTYIPQHDLQEREWFAEFMDFNLDLYLLDISLIPDPYYVNYMPLSSPKSPDRLVAAIYEVLYNEALFEGITAVIEEELIDAINKTQVLSLYHRARPEVSKGDIDNIMARHRNILRKTIHYVEDLSEGRIFQLKHVREIEKTIEETIKKLLSKELLIKLDINASEHIEYIIKSVSNRLSEAKAPENQKKEFLSIQRSIYEKALRYGLIVISGGAGTGKTETIINLVELFSRIGKKPIYIVTPTGKSALVVEERLRKRNLLKDVAFISTVHRLLYSYYFERFSSITGFKKEFHELVELIDKTLNDIRFFNEFKNYINRNSNLKIQPKILIIDEASMVDEILLALLFSIINIDSLEHLIIVGDSNQLPPIGLGKPFVDIIDFLKEKYEDQVIILETPIRFPIKTGIWAFSQTFTSPDNPVDDLENYIDDTLKIYYFHVVDDLKGKITGILKELLSETVGNHSSKPEILDLLNTILEIDSSEERPSLEKIDKIQILAPTRYGELGTEYINRVIVLKGRNVADCEYAKIINEQNRYVELSTGKILLLPNGSLGCWTKKRGGRVFFREVKEILNRLPYDRYNDRKIVYNKLQELVNEVTGRFKEGDSYISPGYAITVHKAQGSDFDYVIFILSRISSFATKELIYTALTRAKRRLYLLLNTNLKDNIILILQQVKMFSELDRRSTLLFKYRRYPGRVYSLRLKNGETIYLRSKTEYIIAKTLDSLDVEFKYEPSDLRDHGIIPDFKVVVDGKQYFIEHLGLLDKEVYRRRWEIKRRIYEKLGLLDQVITTSEPMEGNIDVEGTIKRIISDIREDKLMETKSGFPSKHHYVLTSSS